MSGAAQVFDYVVIGGGTSGTIMAARLSADPGCHVLLVEAGPDHPPAAKLPEALSDANMALIEGFNWDITAMRRPAVDPRLGRVSQVLQTAAAHGLRLNPAAVAGGTQPMPYPMAKVMGGGSAVNGAFALHAPEQDFAAWAERGNAYWGSQAAQVALPMPVETPTSANYTPVQRAFLERCRELGLLAHAQASGGVAGVAPIPRNTVRGKRCSNVVRFLDPVRGRANLTVWANCQAQRLLLDDSGNATGVVLARANGTCAVAARHVVLAAGAVSSPALLQRSGIGSAALLRKLGIPVLVDLPGVGAGLADHPAVTLWGVPTVGTCRAGEDIHQMLLQHASAGSAHPDLLLFMLGGVETARFPGLRSFVGADLAVGISVVLGTPRSTGKVEIASADPNRAPLIDLNCLENDHDLRRMAEGTRLAWRLLQGPTLSRHVARLALWTEELVQSDKLLTAALKRMVGGAWHPTGTLRMGPADDRLAVCDQFGQLRGCSNVTVVDASLMPVIPSVPPNLCCMLVAERLAARLVGH